MNGRLRRAIDLASLLILLVAVAVLASTALRQSQHAPVESGADRMSVSDFSPLLANGHWLGPRDAPAVILVYSTYACGFCGELHQYLTELRRRYPQHLAVVVKHFVKPVRGPELNMALAAECAAENGNFDDFHLAAFAHQEVVQYRDGWRQVADAAEIRPRAAFDECVLSQKHADIVEAHYRQALQLGVTGTPTMFVDGIRVNGVVPEAVLDSLIAQALRR